jgi:hypothetical protein
MKINWTTLSNRAALAAILSAVAFTACGESNDGPDDDIINPSGGRNSSGDGDGEGDGDNTGDGDGDTTGDGDGDGKGGQGGGGNGDGDGDGDTGTGGNLTIEPEREDCPAEPNDESEKLGDCWDLSDCNGVSTEQFLNQCAGDGPCQGFFDNEDKIEGFDGTLPPLN